MKVLGIECSIVNHPYSLGAKALKLEGVLYELPHRGARLVIENFIRTNILGNFEDYELADPGATVRNHKLETVNSVWNS